MNVDKYIYSRPNKATRTDLHCTIDYWSEVEEQSIERTGKIGLIVVELWSCMSRSSQALAPHKHSLLTSTGFDDQKQMTLEGSQWPKNRWQCSQWPKTNVLEGFLLTVLFQVTEQNQNIHRTEIRIFTEQNQDIPMTGNFWSQDDAQVMMWHRLDEIATDEWLSLNRNGGTATQQTQNRDGNISTSLCRMLTVLVSN